MRENNTERHEARGGDKDGGGRPATRRPFFRRHKTCPFSGPSAPKIDYKDIKLLQRFVSCSLTRSASPAG